MTHRIYQKHVVPIQKKSMLILDGASYTENICTLGKYKSVHINNKLILRF